MPDLTEPLGFDAPASMLTALSNAGGEPAVNHIGWPPQFSVGLYRDLFRFARTGPEREASGSIANVRVDWAGPAVQGPVQLDLLSHRPSPAGAYRLIAANHALGLDLAAVATVALAGTGPISPRRHSTTAHEARDDACVVAACCDAAAIAALSPVSANARPVLLKSRILFLPGIEAAEPFSVVTSIRRLGRRIATVSFSARQAGRWIADGACTASMQP